MDIQPGVSESIGSSLRAQAAQPLRSSRNGVVTLLLIIATASALGCVPPAAGTTPTKKSGAFGDEPDNSPSMNDTNNNTGPSTFPSSGPSTGPTNNGGVTQFGCHGYGACYGACNSQATSDAQYAACSQACDQHATQSAISQLNSAYNCGVSACIQAGQCTSQQDASDNCTLCAYDAVSAIFGLPCSGDPMCNTQQCAQAVNSCMSAMP